MIPDLGYQMMNLILFLHWSNALKLDAALLKRIVKTLDLPGIRKIDAVFNSNFNFICLFY